VLVEVGVTGQGHVDRLAFGEGRDLHLPADRAVVGRCFGLAGFGDDGVQYEGVYTAKVGVAVPLLALFRKTSGQREVAGIDR
jgi:hypothetical protein